MLPPDDIISFSKQIIYGLNTSWGKSWAQREIDGLFYNEYLNDPLQLAFKEARLARLGREDPPFPYRWDGPDAQGIFFRPWGSEEKGDTWYIDVGGLKQMNRSDIRALSESMLKNFAVNPEYVYSAMVHGTPIPFLRFWPRVDIVITTEGDVKPPTFQLDIYALPFGTRELTLVKVHYERFCDLAYNLDVGEPKLKDHRIGANVEVDLLGEVSARIAVLSHHTYASPGVFAQVVKEAVKEHGSSLPGKARVSTIPTVREWVVYMLSVRCSLSNREAITLWNERLGTRLDYPYTMDKPDKGLRGYSVASPGESHFSGDKAELEQRINFYRSTLTRSLPISG